MNDTSEGAIESTYLNTGSLEDSVAPSNSGTLEHIDNLNKWSDRALENQH